MTQDRQRTERRSHVRIKDRVLFHYRILDPEEYKRIICAYEDGIETPWSPYNHPQLTGDLKVHLKRLREKDEALACCIDVLDQKLNLILNLLQKDEFESCPATPCLVDISAAGVAFEANEPIERNSFLEMDIGLLPQHLFLRCYGRVLRCSQPKTSGPYKIAVKFIWMTEDDQDRLIEHIFRHQVIQLRMRRSNRRKKKK